MQTCEGGREVQRSYSSPIPSSPSFSFGELGDWGWFPAGTAAVTRKLRLMQAGGASLSARGCRFFFCLLAPEPRLERATGDQLRKGMSREIASILEIASAPGTANEGERRTRESLWVEDASK